MKYRVIVNGVSFYTTGAAIKRGVGDCASVNCVVRQLFGNMFNAVGIASTLTMYDHKMNRVNYDVQISLVK
jgi:hypothetical protein